MPRDFLTTEDWSRADLQRLLDDAEILKADPIQPRLKDKSIALLFFNPSLRTRTSFELGMQQLGGFAIVLQPGRGAWPIEFEDGVVMDGESEEHAKEAARVLSAYCDAIAVRAFPKFQDWSVDREDRVIKQFARYATVPVVNMETITHPCQELALMQAIQQSLALPEERARHALGRPDGKKLVLTWTYHPRPLNTAVANSALLIATKFGMDVTLLCPTEDYLLDPRYMEAAKANIAAQGGSFQVSHDIAEAYADADFVYAKSWGALPYFGAWEREKPIRDQYKHFIVDSEKMALTNNGKFSHCLPARRNVKATDEVMDSPAALTIVEAENRLHVQKALLSELLG